MSNWKDLSRNAYETLIEDKSLSHKIEKWNFELDVNITTDELYRYFKNIYITTNIPKFRSFQYRLIHRAIITNVHLYKWRKISSDLCSFCGECRETYSHLFVMCKNIREIWVKTEEFLMSYNESEIIFNIPNVIFNQLISSPRNVKNFVCLMLKQYIYKQRCLKQVPTFYEFRSILQRRMDKRGSIINKEASWLHAELFLFVTVVAVVRTGLVEFEKLSISWIPLVKALDSKVLHAML